MGCRCSWSPNPASISARCHQKFRRGSPGRVIRGRLGTSRAHACSHSTYQIASSRWHAEREAARKLGRPGLTADAISEIHVSLFSEGTARIIRLVLDGDWTEHVCRSLALRADVEHEA